MKEVCNLWVPGALGPGGSSKRVTIVIPEAPLIYTASQQVFILQSALISFSFCFVMNKIVNLYVEEIDFVVTFSQHILPQLYTGQQIKKKNCICDEYVINLFVCIYEVSKGT